MTLKTLHIVLGVTLGMILLSLQNTNTLLISSDRDSLGFSMSPDVPFTSFIFLNNSYLLLNLNILFKIIINSSILYSIMIIRVKNERLLTFEGAD
jgi:hypothetical protein